MDVVPIRRWTAGIPYRPVDIHETKAPRPLLNARQIEAIAAVARTGSVTEAANLLGVSQPAVSMMLRECNDLVGFPLFERRRGRMQPAQETSLLIPEMDSIIDGLHRIGRLLGDLREASTGRVRLALPAVLADALLPHALTSFQRELATLNLQILSTEDPVTDVESDNADLGLALGPVADRHASTNDIGLTSLVCAMHVDHPLARRRHLTVDDFCGTAIVRFDDGSSLGALQRGIFHQAGFLPEVTCQVSSVSTALALAERNIGIAIVPDLTVGLARRGLAIVRFVPETALVLRLVLPTDRRVSRAGRRLSVVIRAAARHVLGAAATGSAISDDAAQRSHNRL